MIKDRDMVVPLVTSRQDQRHTLRAHAEEGFLVFVALAVLARGDISHHCVCGDVFCPDRRHDPGRGGHVRAWCSRSHVHRDSSLEPSAEDVKKAQ